jgi:alpha-ketoglutarate-dependent taurine dioxygenase
LTAEEQIAFTRTLGDYVSDLADGGVTPITIDPSGGRSARYTQSSFFWHFDGYMNAVPILASLLCCVRPSPTGGDTEFCNTYAAWEALPAARKAQIEGLKAVHATAGAQLSVEPEPSYEQFSEWLKVPHNTLPLVWTHRSGRRSLVIGNTAVNIVGLDPLEGLELLVWLRDWATQPRFSYSHRWRPGDAVLWDNTGTLHRATPYPVGSGREMRRTKLAGEEPFA